MISAASHEEDDLHWFKIAEVSKEGIDDLMRSVFYESDSISRYISEGLMEREVVSLRGFESIVVRYLSDPGYISAKYILTSDEKSFFVHLYSSSDSYDRLNALMYDKIEGLIP